MSILDKNFSEIAELKAQNRYFMERIQDLDINIKELELENTKLKEQVESTRYCDRWWENTCVEFMNELAEKYPDDFQKVSVTSTRNGNSHYEYKIEPWFFIQYMMEMIKKKDLIFKIFE